MKKILLILTASLCVPLAQASVMQVVKRLGLYAGVTAIGTCATVISAANIGLAMLFGKGIVDAATGRTEPFKNTKNVILSAAGMGICGGVGAWSLKECGRGFALTARMAKNDLSPIVRKMTQKLANTLRRVK